MKPIRGGLLAGVGAIVALLALSPAISWATFPGANGRIAYSCQTQDSPDYEPPGICTIRPDGSGMVKIADNARSPSWSANGRRLVFVRDSQLFTMDADGGNQTQITHGDALKGSPQFSPNGRRIVFAKVVAPGAGPRARTSLWKIRADGSDPKRIVSDYADRPIYLPNGRRIVFQGRPRGAARDGIWKIRPNGSHLRRLTAPPVPSRWEAYVDGLLDVSPGGGQILFLRCNEVERWCGSIRWWVMRPDGSGKRPAPIRADGYSPNGNRFVFATGESEPVYGTDYCLDIHTIRPNGTDDRALTHNCDGLPPGDYADLAYAPSWQPIPQP
jgi:hypothetical protein